MFSQLGPLFKTTLRQTEANDTRQKIPHDERDKINRKREEAKGFKEQVTEEWDDNTTVSVIALRNFLIDFLKTMPEADGMEILQEPAKKEPRNKRPHEVKRPTNTRNAKAVRAYQTMAEHASHKPDKKSDDNQINNTSNADKIESQELRDIYKLIEDLETLDNRNVKMLTIQKADSFVLGMQSAVKKLLG